jgi:hypothetical protein
MARLERVSGPARVLTGLLAVALVIGTIYMVKPASGDIQKLSGTLIFHRYSDYASWDATMWSLDLKSGAFNQINENWTTVISPINAHVRAMVKI